MMYDEYYQKSYMLRPSERILLGRVRKEIGQCRECKRYDAENRKCTFAHPMAANPTDTCDRFEKAPWIL